MATTNKAYQCAWTRYRDIYIWLNMVFICWNHTGPVPDIAGFFTIRYISYIRIEYKDRQTIMRRPLCAFSLTDRSSTVYPTPTCLFFSYKKDSKQFDFISFPKKNNSQFNRLSLFGWQKLCCSRICIASVVSLVIFIKVYSLTSFRGEKMYV